MEINLVGIALMADDPAASAQWFVDHFGFTVNTDIGWYVNTRHEGHANLSLDFVQRDHASSPDVLRGKRVAGTLLAFLVDDVDAEERRLREAGLDFVLSIATEGWGQRRFQVTGPDGLVVEVLQMVPPDPDWLAAHGLTPD
jgi:catechol 2,3-dioxygenase-like lactoylglutathione lyase family enzyme